MKKTPESKLSSEKPHSEKREITITQTTSLTLSQKEAILSLWNHEYPGHLQYKDLSGLQNYLDSLIEPLHYTISDKNQQIKAWLVTFTREGARWFAMIVDGSLHGKGIGTQLLNAAKAHETELNGWATDHNRDLKADGTPYPSPIEFYRKNDFEVLTDVRLEKGSLSTVKIKWGK